MNLLNMIDRAKIHELIRFFQLIVLKFCDLLGGRKMAVNTKFQLSISKIVPANPKTQGNGV